MQRAPVASIALSIVLLAACGSDQTSGQIPESDTAETEDTGNEGAETVESEDDEPAEEETAEGEEASGDAPPADHTARYEEQYENECDGCRMVEATPSGPDAPELGRHSPPHGSGCMRGYTRLDTNPPHHTMRACPDHCCEE